MIEELWMIRGNNPVHWSIPFYLTNDGHSIEWAAHPAIPLLRIQQKAVDERLIQVARRVNGMWMIVRSELRKIGTIATAGTDPETLLAWDRKRALKFTKHTPEKNREREEFLDSLYQVGVGKSREEVGNWWYLFCNHALDWLINKEQPIDMFFVKLLPMPYRSNWIEKTERERQHLFHARKSIHRRDRLRAWFENAKLLGVNRNGTIDRQIVAEPTKLWWKTIIRVEKTRLERLKPVGYAAIIIESMRNAAPAAARIYRTWLAQKKAFVGAFGEGRMPGNIRIMASASSHKLPIPDFGTSQKYRAALRNISPQKYIELHARARALSQKNGKLPEVPDIQPPGKNVRNGGNND